MESTARVVKNNQVILVGTIVSEKLEFAYNGYGENFYKFYVSVKRLSQNNDIILVVVSEEFEQFKSLKKGERVYIEGQYRSFYQYEEDIRHMVLSVFSRKIILLGEETFEEEDKNIITLRGSIAKEIVYRETPLGKKIADVFLSVDRAYDKRDYIPIIVWGKDAKWISNFEPGTEVQVLGRIQSRRYLKRISKAEYEELSKVMNLENLEMVEKDGDVEYFEKRIAYEVSALKIKLISG